MKKLILMLLMFSVFIVPAFADPTVQLYQSGYSYSNGGEFTAVYSGWSPLGTYSANTSTISSFQTFCIEYNEEFYPGATYSVDFGPNAIEGGVGPQGDPISQGTAYLYYEFATGNLAGYDYTNSLGLRSADAGALQQAIWYLEQENNGALNAYTDLVTAKFTSLANAMADNNNLYPVEVMRMWDQGYVDNLDHRSQDQLVLDGIPSNDVPTVPVPGAILLGGIGVGLVGWFRKRSFLR